MEAKQTPLIELLERIPQDARLVVEHDQFSSSVHPVGRLCREAAAALRTALEQPEQESVTYQDTAEKCRLETVPAKGTLLYTAPPQRKPLTDMHIADIYKKWDATPGVSMADFARAIEAAHNIKE